MTDTRAKFKDPAMARMYETCRRLGADPASEFFVQGGPRTGSNVREAYWWGRHGNPRPKAGWSRASILYAAWAAGRDDHRAAKS